MFIDAAHQYEALLDVLLILGQIDVALLRSGCDEIISTLFSAVCHVYYHHTNVVDTVKLCQDCLDFDPLSVMIEK